MFAVSCISGLILILAVSVCQCNTNEQPDIEETFEESINEISNLLKIFENLVKTVAEAEKLKFSGQLYPELSQPLNISSEALEGLFDEFERTCQSFRARFFKFVKSKTQSIEVLSEQEYIPSENILTSTPGMLESTSEYTSAEPDLSSASEVQQEFDSFNQNEALVEHDESIMDQTVAQDSITGDTERSIYTTYVPMDNEATESYEISEPLGWMPVTDSEQVAEFNEVIEDRSGLLLESENPLFVSIPGVPGKDFPDFSQIPETSFTCEDKEYVPGFYADTSTNCQVFHACWPDHIESFLCPTGTTFNQEILTCDYWFNSTCSDAPSHNHANVDLADPEIKFVPVQFKTAYHTVNLQPENLDLNKIDSTLKEHIEEELSHLQMKTLARKLYEEIIRSSAELDNIKTEAGDALLHKMEEQMKKLRKEKLFESLKDDRSGDIEVTDSNSENDRFLTVTPIYEESLISTETGAKPDMKKLHSKMYKENIAPLIVLKVFETAENVVNKGLLPLTREILAASYSKLHKTKKD